jgi:hypothetical protein
MVKLLVDLSRAEINLLDETAAPVKGSRASVIRALISQLDSPAVRRRVASAQHVAHGGRRDGAGRPTSPPSMTECAECEG